ncbi:MAG: HEAT repeat domain-containing protein [Planctomycetota bacterium]
MHVLAAVLIACLLPFPVDAQAPPRRPKRKGRIELPLPRPQPRQAQDTSPKRNDINAFHRDVFKLRRSRHAPNKDVELILRQLREDYDKPNSLALSLAGRVDADQLHGVMRVLRRYGDKRDSAELQFLLLTRSMGKATAITARTMTDLDPERAKANLIHLLQAKFAPVRKTASELLRERVDNSDLATLLQLSYAKKSDVRRKVIRLLGCINEPRSRKRLLQIMVRNASLAGEACMALVKHGPAAVPDLQAIVSTVATNWGFGYAALALARLEDATGKHFVLPAMVPHLKSELSGRNPFLRTTAAIALVSLARRSAIEQKQELDDRSIVDGLLLVVAPIEFVTDLSLLQGLATSKLIEFSGEDFRGRTGAWRSWWSSSREFFVGMRQRIDVTEENAAFAHLTWSGPSGKVMFRGERVPASETGDALNEYILAPSEVISLCAKLEQLGFMTSRRSVAESKVERMIDLRVAGARIRLRLPSTEQPFVTEMWKVVLKTAHAQRWQRYRDPSVHPDITPFWRVERKWMLANPDKLDLRLKEKILARLPHLEGAARKRAISDLTSIPDLKKLITEEDGVALLKYVAKAEKIDGDTFEMIEVALLAPGDTIWRRALGVLERRMTQSTDAYVVRMFALLGSDKVLLALQHPSVSVRVAAMHEVAKSRDLRAVPTLLAKLNSRQLQEQRTAIYALGVLRAVEARKPLLAMESRAHAAMRREVWVALGRIGGLTVVDVLIEAVRRPDRKDRIAGLNAMGEMKNARIADFLARRFASQGTVLDEFGRRTLLSLRNQGAVIARAQLRKYVQRATGAVRTRLVLLLGEFHDPNVVGDLIELLGNQRHRLEATIALSEITGVDLTGFNDRQQAMRAWYRTHKAQPRQMWFLEALRNSKVSTTLNLRHLTLRQGIESVPELARLLKAVEQPYLRMMVLSMLQDVTRVEFGRLSRVSSKAAVEAVADRYLYHAEAVKAAQAK